MSSLFKNKHFIVALLVCPVLAIVAYVGTDLAVSEKPHAAVPGQSYMLASQSNCRYTSGLCKMENGDFNIQFRSENITAEHLTLSLSSAFPLQGVKLALVDSPDAGNGEIIEMTSQDNNAQQWTVTLPAPRSAQSQLRVVVSANDTLYIGETGTEFVRYETLFTDQQ
uniref:hypothetical protein n=1 Tax=Thaumasiovibrio occultus TaxID=1891184 RepID=UPI000B355E9E|nr:hypothetical protein [Thaumasiovibrio occultus]